jgi:DNA mismatch repair protein MutL
MSLSQRGARSDWTQTKLSEATVPIENGKSESLRSRQIETELFTSPTPSEAAKQPAPTPPPPTPAKKKEAFVQMSAEDYVRQYVKDGADKKLEQIARREEEKIETKIEEKIEPKIEPKPVEEPPKVVPPQITEQERVPSVTEEATKADEPMPISEPPAPQTLEYRIVGEAFNSYVIVERGDVMLLIDKHAAHERIIFEELKAAMKSSTPTSQMLMLPIEVMMTSEEIQTVGTYKGEIEAVGFELSLGRYSVSVSAIPEGIGTEAVSDMLVVMAERIKSGTGTAGLTRDIVFEKALYQASCKAAIKAGREYADAHVKWIVDKLMALPDITVCPHGRPVAMELSKKNLDRQFERT